MHKDPFELGKIEAVGGPPPAAVPSGGRQVEAGGAARADGAPGLGPASRAGAQAPHPLGELDRVSLSEEVVPALEVQELGGAGINFDAWAGVRPVDAPEPVQEATEAHGASAGADSARPGLHAGWIYGEARLEGVEPGMQVGEVHASSEDTGGWRDHRDPSR